MSADPNSSRYAPKNWPFFYGWMILFAGTVGAVTTAPGQTLGVGPFTESLLTALGLSRVNLTTAYMVGTIGSALLLTRAGKLYDRYGARVIAPMSSFMFALSLLALSQCDRIGALLDAAVPLVNARWAALIVVTLCFFALRFSAQGVLFMISFNMMMKWFDRHRGLATGITGIVIAPGFSASPRLLNYLVVQMGWREAWQLLAVVIGIGFSLFAWIFFRDNPESCGLKPDGPWGERALGSRRPPHRPHVQFTLAEARRCRSFWIFCMGLSSFSFIATGFTFHVASIFENAGLTAAQGFDIFLPAAVGSVLLRPLVGWMADRVPLKFLLMAMLAGVMALSASIAALGPRWTLLLLQCGMAICGATLGTLMSVTWANFFGRSHLGAISGFNSAIMVFASAIGPWIYSHCFRLTESYTVIAVVGFIWALVLMCFAGGANDPQVSEE